jgi:DNA invertase Pin-like site-specific DNA recombinase
VLDPLCERVFEESATRRRLAKNRPQHLAALNDVGHDDPLVISKVRYLAQTPVDGLEVLTDLVDRRVAARVLAGMATGDHTEQSLFLDQSREIVEIRRTILTQKINAGLRAARERGAVLGRPRTVDEANIADIVSRREQGESLRSIARAVDA